MPNEVPVVMVHAQSRLSSSVPLHTFWRTLLATFVIETSAMPLPLMIILCIYPSIVSFVLPAVFTYLYVVNDFYTFC